jgi:hypothetical protein
MDRDDVGMTDPGNGASFGQKPAGDRLVQRQFGVDDLDGHPPVERGIGGKEDHTHAAAAELPLEPVLRPKRPLECGEEIDGGIAHVRHR